MNSGAVTLGGGAITATASGSTLTDASGSLLNVHGTINAAKFSNAGMIEASGGVLNLQSGVTGSGLAQVDAGATLDVGAALSGRRISPDRLRR